MRTGQSSHIPEFTDSDIAPGMKPYLISTTPGIEPYLITTTLGIQPYLITTTPGIEPYLIITGSVPGAVLPWFSYF